jgi:hypothetical protein
LRDSRVRETGRRGDQLIKSQKTRRRGIVLAKARLTKPRLSQINSKLQATCLFRRKMKLQLMLISPAGDPALRLSLHSSLSRSARLCARQQALWWPPRRLISPSGDPAPRLSLDSSLFALGLSAVRSARLCAQQQAWCGWQHHMCA